MPISIPSLPKIDLFCTTGGANKEYHLHTVANLAGDFTLFFSNGAIGSVMTPKVKTGPTTLEAVQREFAKTVKTKTGASPPYTESSSGVVYTVTKDAGDASGWLPQLLGEIEPHELEAVLRNNDWVASEKINGQRRALLKIDGEWRGANKRGRFIGGVPQSWSDALVGVPDDTIIDGEARGDVLHVFDMPRMAGQDMRSEPYAVRLGHLYLVVGVHCSKVAVLNTATSEQAKRDLLNEVGRLDGPKLGEGLVFTRNDSLYLEGRASGQHRMDRIKFKFYEFANALVLRKNTGRSVALGLLRDDGSVIEVGSVTIPANQSIPEAGSALKVRYMHMFEGGSLYGPPVSFGTVPGVDRSECLLSQVKRICAKSSVVEMDDDDYAGEEPEVAAQRERPRG